MTITPEGWQPPTREENIARYAWLRRKWEAAKGPAIQATVDFINGEFVRFRFADIDGGYLDDTLLKRPREVPAESWLARYKLGDKIWAVPRGGMTLDDWCLFALGVDAYSV
jgi:hypothetical protein